MSQDIAVPAAIAGLVSETQTREPYKHACRGKFTPRVERANTRPYSSFGFRSNARWFLQTMPDGSCLNPAIFRAHFHIGLAIKGTGHVVS